MPSTCVAPPRPGGAGLLGPQLVVAGGARGPGRAPRRSRRCRSSVPVRVVYGKASGGSTLRRRTLGRVHADLGREQVDGPLERGRRLGPAGAAVGDQGRGGGDDRGRREPDVLQVVDAARHHAGHPRQQRAHARVGAGVLQHVEAVGGDAAVARAADGDVLHLAAAVAHGGHVLGAGLEPAHRSAEPDGPAHRAAAARAWRRPWRRSCRRRRGTTTRTSAGSSP